MNELLRRTIERLRLPRSVRKVEPAVLPSSEFALVASRLADRSSIDGFLVDEAERIAAAVQYSGGKKRILHVGNIAQNAYVNAKLLREAGFDCHVLCFDLYDAFSSPEWQEANDSALSARSLGPPMFPNFYLLSRQQRSMPYWFAKGPMFLSFRYLESICSGDFFGAAQARCAIQYNRLKAALWETTAPTARTMTIDDLAKLVARLNLVDADVLELGAGHRSDQLLDEIREIIAHYNGAEAAAACHAPFTGEYLQNYFQFEPKFAARIEELRKVGTIFSLGMEVPPIAEVATRKSDVTPEDFAAFEMTLPWWKSLCKNYDLVIVYGGQVQFATLADVEFVAYEHGTIRDLPFEDRTQGRLIKRGYERAKHVFITNADYVNAKRRLEIPPQRRTYLPHAFDERPLLQFKSQAKRVPSASGQVRFFSACRHDWTDHSSVNLKRNDLIFDAAARLVASGRTNFKVRFVEWGVDVKNSKRRLEELGLSTYVEWVAPMSKRSLWQQYIDASAVIDHFSLSTINGVQFEAMALGCRVIAKDDGISNREFFGSQPPLLAACDVPAVERQMATVIDDPEDLAGIGADAARWILEFHSSARIVRLQEEVFERLSNTDFNPAQCSEWG